MSKKVEKEKNELIEEFFKRNDQKDIKSMGDIPVKVPRDRNGQIDSDLVPKYSRIVNGFDEKIISMYALGLSDKDIQEWQKRKEGCLCSIRN